MTMKFPIINTMVRAMRQPIVAVPQILWVPNLLGAQYGQLTVPWVPDGADWELEIVALNTILTDFLILSSGGDNTPYHLIHADGRYTYNDGVGGSATASTGTISIGDLHEYRLVASSIAVDSYLDDVFLFNVTSSEPADWQYIARWFSDSNYFSGQIHSLKLTDPLDGVVNGRDVVELDGVDQYATVPTWVATNGTIEFDFSQKTTPPSSEFIIDGRDAVGAGFVWTGAGNIAWGGMSSVEVDGVIESSGSIVVVQDRVYHIKATPSSLSLSDFDI